MPVSRIAPIVQEPGQQLLPQLKEPVMKPMFFKGMTIRDDSKSGFVTGHDLIRC
jgi:hypothetical protein